jgi:hypothetical protein
MKIVLRVISLWEGLLALATAAQTAILLKYGLLSPESLRGWVMVLCLVARPVVSAVAAVQLWRLRPSGRQASMLLGMLFGMISLVQVGGVTDRVRGFLFCAVLMGVMLSPSAASSCRQDRTAVHDPAV